MTGPRLHQQNSRYNASVIQGVFFSFVLVRMVRKYFQAFSVLLYLIDMNY